MKTAEEIAEAAKQMDWQQVVLNGGPPCFHVCEDGRFCGRAKRWDGHEDLHKFVSLSDMIAAAILADREERDKRVIEVLEDAIAAENRIGYAAHTKLSALLAELRKGEK